MSSLEVGLVGTASLTVGPGHTAQAFGSGSVPVFSTPRLVALLEEAAVHATAGRLDPGDTTVGTRVEVVHVAATPVGDSVRAEARLESIDGRRLAFTVAAFDSTAKIGEGRHERIIVNEQRFLEKVRDKAVTAAEASAGPVAPAAPSVAKKRLTILLVDDDDQMRETTRRALEQLPVHAELLFAADGLEALNTVESVVPDLVILDLMMPRMDGFTVCRKLRESVRTAFVPIIMLTACADDESRTTGFLLGTDDFITKPFGVGDLKARVMRILRRAYGI
jgi:fluoroacetyl-CoA thioesterase